MDGSKLVVILSCFLMVSTGSRSNDKKADKSDFPPRIINGENVSHDMFPFLVSIEVYLYYSSEWSSTCGGSIVNRETILTACHCLTSDEKIHGNTKYMANPDSLRVVAGTAYWARNSPTRQVRNVRRLVTHPKCKNFHQFDMNFVNDVGLVFLKRPLDYTAQVGPLALPSRNIPEALEILRRLVYERTPCTTVGWGRIIEADSQQSKTLQAAAVQLLTSKECRQRFCKMTYGHCKTDFQGLGQICVVSPESSDCYGDSGGPLVCNGVVVGTVSYGDRCLPNLPTVYQGLRPILEVLAINRVKIDDAGDVGASDFLGYDLGNRPQNFNKTGVGNFIPLLEYPLVFPELGKINRLLQKVVKRPKPDSNT